MPNVSEVRPEKWEEVLDLYDDGDFSAVWGKCDKSANRELGVRWNGSEGKVGYPNQGGNPLWFSEPEFLQRPILLSLLDKVNSSKLLETKKAMFTGNILDALRECRSVTDPSTA